MGKVFWFGKRKKELVYARRDMRSENGILRNCDKRPKYYILPKVYEKLNKKEKEKWLPIEICK